MGCGTLYPHSDTWRLRRGEAGEGGDERHVSQCVSARLQYVEAKASKPHVQQGEREQPSSPPFFPPTVQ